MFGKVDKDSKKKQASGIQFNQSLSVNSYGLFGEGRGMKKGKVKPVQQQGPSKTF